MLIVSVSQSPRVLKNCITGLLKSSAAQSIKKINYTKSYSLESSKVVGQEQKILIIKFPPAQKDKLVAMLQKQLPGCQIDEISESVLG